MFLECQLPCPVEPRLCADVRSSHCGDTNCLVGIGDEGKNEAAIADQGVGR